MRPMLVLVLAAGILAPACAQESRKKKSPAFAAKDVDRIRALVKPSETEALWDQIPWLTSLWDGRMRAAAEGKPMLIWEANGNPIGIT